MLATRFQNEPRVLLAASRMLVAPDEQIGYYAEDHKGALEFAREALRRNAASPFCWSRLGSALLDYGHKEEARHCFERALQLGPNLISNLALGAQFYYSIGERRQALRCTSRILELAPSYKDSILESYASSQYELADTLKYGLPQDPLVARAYFRVLLKNDEPEAIRQAWEWLAARSLPDDRLAYQYVDYLMRAREYDQALAIWIPRVKEHENTYLKSSFLYNGGFESEPCGSVFDWRISGAQGVEAARDSDIVHSGKWSLRIAFGGEANLSYRHVSQELVLNHGSYRFRAYLRTQDITTDKGIAFRIYDPDDPRALNIRTEQLNRTHDWTEVDVNVPVGETTRRVRIEVVREASEKFDNLIKGQVWIDDLQMTKYE